ncbi:hypothetical protein E4H12_04060 [Candidatus Thorarchaeota archaeon]|nr:MAG: hypothetical protein E4H12_04060 [Candidatus Thorarchaeota archaeon]
MKTDWIRITGDNADQLRVGDRLKEIDLDTSIYSIVVTPVQQTGDPSLVQWTWDAAIIIGGTIHYLITRGFEQYGPEVYVAKDEEGEPEQLIVDTDVSSNKQESVTI